MRNFPKPFLLVLAFILAACLNPDVSPGQIFIDQIGYLPGSKKYVFVNGSADSFKVVAQGSGTTVFAGELALWKSSDPATGLTLNRGDFSALQVPGQYHIEIASLGRSHTFAIGDSVFFQPYRMALKGFFLQRCGTELLGVHAGAYLHPQCHIGDGFLHASTDTSGFRLSRGGWHDAGDYGKYVVNAGVTVGTLLMAYELFAVKFDQDDLGIPESGNGVPDLLDEVRYELEWLLSMQHPGGGAYHKLTTENFAPFVMPQNAGGIRYIYQISTTATGDLAAVLAKAARIYQPFDADFAQTCLAAAEKAWAFLESTPVILPFPNGFKNPAGTQTGEYGDSHDLDERLWAAAELFITTGKSEYHAAYQALTDDLNLIDSAMSWPNVKALGHLAYLFGKQEGKSSSLESTLRTSLMSFCEAQVARSDASGFHLVLRPGEFVWGSNSDVLNRAIMLILGFQQTGRREFYDTALEQLHYIFGANAHNLCFVTGTGAVAPVQPHHRPSIADGIAAPVPGLLAGGPNQYLNDPVLSARFDSGTPPALAYVDHVDSYASNEIAINWNAPLVLVAGYFSAGGPATAVEAPADRTPDSYRLLQNYPNPFNPTTTIAFELPQPGWTTLRIFNIGGQEIARFLGRQLKAGSHAIQFDAAHLSAGVYFYQIQSENFFGVKRMLLLK